MKVLEDNFLLDGEDLKKLTDYDYIKKHLFFRLMPMSALQENGLDAKIPYKQLGDIAITCSFTVKEDEHSRCNTFFVNEGLEQFGIDKEQLFDDTFKSSMLESGEFSHSGSGEKRQFWSKEKSQHIR